MIRKNLEHDPNGLTEQSITSPKKYLQELDRLKVRTLQMASNNFPACFHLCSNSNVSLAPHFTNQLAKYFRQVNSYDLKKALVVTKWNQNSDAYCADVDMNKRKSSILQLTRDPLQSRCGLFNLPIQSTYLLWERHCTR